MVNVTIPFCRHEFKTLKRIAEEQFPFFDYLDDEDKVRSAIEYLVEREVASNGYEG